VVVSLALLQLPALTLAILGLLRAAQRTEGRAAAAARALLLAFVPFFLLEFLNSFLDFLFQQCLQKGLTRAKLLDFLGPTDKRRILAVDTARAFSGSAIQLVLQVSEGHLL
jgi:hypothetical protein